MNENDINIPGVEDESALPPHTLPPFSQEEKTLIPFVVKRGGGIAEMPKTYGEILRQSIEEDWGYVPTRCPHCHNGAVSFGNENRNGETLYGITVCSCDVCGREWWEEDDRDD